MKRRYRLMPSTALVAAGLGVAGCQISEHALEAYDKPPVEQQVGDGAVEAAEVEQTAPAFRLGAVIHPGDEALPNPAESGPVASRNDHLLRRFYNLTGTQCDGFVARRPAVILDAPEGLQHVRISVEGDAQLLFVEMPGRDFRCESSPGQPANLMLDGRNWPAGTYRVFVGGPGRMDQLSYAVSVEDMTRATNLAWLRTPPPMIVVDETMSGPKFARATPGDDGRRSAEYGEAGCASGGQNLQYPYLPDVGIEVRQGTNAVLGVRSDLPGSVTLLGPIPEDQRNVPTRCLSALTEQVTLVPGSYYVRYGTAAGTLPSFVDVFVHRADATVDPMAHGGGEVPSGLSVEARRLTVHFPFMSPESLLGSDELRHRLFMAASPDLFVMPTEDLGPSSRTRVFAGRSGERNTAGESETALEYPRKGEPLLLIDDRNVALAADGSLYVVPVDKLTAVVPGSQLAIPVQPRNPGLDFEQMLALAASQDKGRIDYYKQRVAQYDECVAEAFSRVQDRLNRLMADEEGNRNQIDRLRQDTRNRAEQSCGLTQLEDDRLQLVRDLTTSRTARRQAMLDEARARFQR
jgi:hypothetical protein